MICVRYTFATYSYTLVCIQLQHSTPPVHMQLVYSTPLVCIVSAWYAFSTCAVNDTFLLQMRFIYTFGMYTISILCSFVHKLPLRARIRPRLIHSLMERLGAFMLQYPLIDMRHLRHAIIAATLL